MPYLSQRTTPSGTAPPVEEDVAYEYIPPPEYIPGSTYVPPPPAPLTTIPEDTYMPGPPRE